MKYSDKILFYFFLTFFLFACKEETINNTEPEETFSIELSSEEKNIVKELNNYITPINTLPLLLNDNELKEFDVFGNLKIIGLGEATHGTKEFSQMKHRLFKYFVEKHGFRIFALEADMGECIYIDRYITEGKGNIQDVMKKMHSWILRTEEIKEFIEWIKKYNGGKLDNDRIHIFGVDCQFTTYIKDLVLKYLQESSINSPDYIVSILSTLSKLKYGNDSKIDNNLYKRKCDSVTVFLKQNESELISKKGLLQYKIMTHLIEQGKQFIDVATQLSSDYRDLYMADNTLWLTTLMGNNTKVLCWAHNMHIANEKGIYSAGSQGFYLNQHMGNNYMAIAFSFNQGHLLAMFEENNNFLGPKEHNISNLPKRNSINYIFHATKHKDFLLINKKIPANSNLYQWMNKYNPFLNIGLVYKDTKAYSSIPLIQFFDAIIHFHETNASVPYKAL